MFRRPLQRIGFLPKGQGVREVPDVRGDLEVGKSIWMMSLLKNWVKRRHWTWVKSRRSSDLERNLKMYVFYVCENCKILNLGKLSTI
jgi:hypothetical protein